jgi:glycosyltransferase involved in cell wall biosynthesis
MKKISCIIPVYNEGPRIRTVLEAVSNHQLLSEIIVVDDGSKDNTSDIVKEYPNIKLIIHEKNKGKSAAINTGFKAATSEYVFFLDADLVGLNAKNVTDLVQPIIDGKADVSISLRQNAPGAWRAIGLDYISGERVFRKEILEDVMDEVLKLPRFGLEVFINNQIIINNYRIAVINWDNVVSPYKVRKVGWIKGIVGDFFMILDIFKTIGVFGPFIQITKMRKLMVKI